MEWLWIVILVAVIGVGAFQWWVDGQRVRPNTAPVGVRDGLRDRAAEAYLATRIAERDNLMRMLAETLAVVVKDEDAAVLRGVQKSYDAPGISILYGAESWALAKNEWLKNQGAARAKWPVDAWHVRIDGLLFTALPEPDDTLKLYVVEELDDAYTGHTVRGYVPMGSTLDLGRYIHTQKRGAR